MPATDIDHVKPPLKFLKAYDSYTALLLVLKDSLPDINLYLPLRVTK